MEHAHDFFWTWSVFLVLGAQKMWGACLCVFWTCGDIFFFGTCVYLQYWLSFQKWNEVKKNCFSPEAMPQTYLLAFLFCCEMLKMLTTRRNPYYYPIFAGPVLWQTNGARSAAGNAMCRTRASDHWAGQVFQVNPSQRTCLAVALNALFPTLTLGFLF